jgi:hypothetical protein
VSFLFFPWPNPLARLNKYKDNVGAIYEHVHYDKWLNRLIPFLFVAKRALIPYCVFFAKKEIS